MHSSHLLVGCPENTVLVQMRRRQLAIITLFDMGKPVHRFPASVQGLLHRPLNIASFGFGAVIHVGLCLRNPSCPYLYTYVLLVITYSGVPDPGVQGPMNGTSYYKYTREMADPIHGWTDLMDGYDTVFSSIRGTWLREHDQGAAYSMEPHVSGSRSTY